MQGSCRYGRCAAQRATRAAATDCGGAGKPRRDRVADDRAIRRRRAAVGNRCRVSRQATGGDGTAAIAFGDAQIGCAYDGVDIRRRVVAEVAVSHARWKLDGHSIGHRVVQRRDSGRHREDKGCVGGQGGHCETCTYKPRYSAAQGALRTRASGVTTDCCFTQTRRRCVLDHNAIGRTRSVVADRDDVAVRGKCLDGAGAIVFGDEGLGVWRGFAQNDLCGCKGVASAATGSLRFPYLKDDASSGGTKRALAQSSGIRRSCRLVGVGIRASQHERCSTRDQSKLDLRWICRCRSGGLGVRAVVDPFIVSPRYQPADRLRPHGKRHRTGIAIAVWPVGGAAHAARRVTRKGGLRDRAADVDFCSGLRADSIVG